MREEELLGGKVCRGAGKDELFEAGYHAKSRKTVLLYRTVDLEVPYETLYKALVALCGQEFEILNIFHKLDYSRALKPCPQQIPVDLVFSTPFRVFQAKSILDNFDKV